MVKVFLRTVTVSGAGGLRFPDTPIMCLKVFDICVVYINVGS